MARKSRVGVEIAPRLSACPAVPAWMRPELAADLRGKGRIRAARPATRLPHRIAWPAAGTPWRKAAWRDRAPRTSARCRARHAGAVCSQAASPALRATGARQSAATRSFSSARLTTKSRPAGAHQPDVGGDAAGQRRQFGLYAGWDQSEPPKAGDGRVKGVDHTVDSGSVRRSPWWRLPALIYPSSKAFFEELK